MIRCKEYISSRSLDDALEHIDIPDDKIINVQATESHEKSTGWDEYDTYTSNEYKVRIFYKD